MTNADKYLKDGVANEFVKEIDKQLELYGGQFNIVRFLNEPVKPTLSEDEKVILKHIKKQYMFLLRTEDGQLRVADNSLNAFSYSYVNFAGYVDVFEWVQPRRRI